MFQFDRTNPILGVIPRLKFSDKGSYVESDTKVYDQMAFRYLSWVLFPLLVGYAVYSIIYVEQRGWYSWVLNMLYGYLLMFGFITMTPQVRCSRNNKCLTYVISAFHQLQTQVSGSSTVENVDVQIHQHVYWWFVRFCDQDAAVISHWMFQRWYYFPGKRFNNKDLAYFLPL